MFQHILVPVDGSRGSSQALDLAAAHARGFGARISVLFVVEPPGVFYSPGYSYVGLIEDTKKWAQDVLDDALARLRADGVDNPQGHVEEGHPGQVILDKAAAWDIDLIVMGTHGRRGLDRLFLGSVAEEVVRCSPVPVLTVRLRGRA